MVSCSMGDDARVRDSEQLEGKWPITGQFLGGGGKS